MGRVFEIIVIFNVLASGLACTITGAVSLGILNKNGYKLDLMTSPFTVLRYLRNLTKKKQDLKILYYFYLASIIYGLIVLTPFLLLIILVIIQPTT